MVETHGRYAFVTFLEPDGAFRTLSPQRRTDRQIGERLAEQYGIQFLYRDFRPGFRQGQAKARELGLYMQKYCGCVFSEEERYAKQIARDRAAFQQSGAGEAESFIKT